jgi:hypothetical protein
MNLLRLAKFTGDNSPGWESRGLAKPKGDNSPGWESRGLAKPKGDNAETIFRLFTEQVEQAPGGFSQMLCAMDFYFGQLKEIAIIGDRKSQETKQILQVIHNRYIPNKILASFDPGVDSHDIADIIYLLKGRTSPINEEKPTVYVCENYVCKAPTTEPEVLADLLK